MDAWLVTMDCLAMPGGAGTDRDVPRGMIDRWIRCSKGWRCLGDSDPGSGFLGLVGGVSTTAVARAQRQKHRLAPVPAVLHPTSIHRLAPTLLSTSRSTPLHTHYRTFRILSASCHTILSCHSNSTFRPSVRFWHLLTYLSFI
jgi:hypothetical protein